MGGDHIILLFFITMHFIFFHSIVIGSGRPQLEPMSITATRTKKPVLKTAGTSTVVSSSDIMQKGALNLGDALKYEPGVSVPFDFSGADSLVPYLGTGEKGINIRGMDGNRVSINIDGVRQPQEFYTAGGMAGAGRIYFDPSTLSQIELFKSANSSLYGTTAMGGVISGRTVGPQALLGKDLRGNSFSNAITFASVNQSINNRTTTAWGNGNKAVSLVYSFRSGHERQNNGSVLPDPQNFDSNAVVTRFTSKSEMFKLSGTVDLFNLTSFTDVNSIEIGNNRSITHQSERERERFSISLETLPNFESELTDSIELNAFIQDAVQKTINFQDRSDNNSLRRRNINFITSTVGFDSFFKKEIDAGPFEHKFHLGFEISESEIESNYLQTDFLQDGRTRNDNRNSMAPSISSEIAFFILDEINFGEQDDWTLSPSLRFDFYEVKPRTNEAFRANSASVGFTPVNFENEIIGTPGISLLHRYNDNVNYYFSYNRGVRNPTAEELNGFFEHPPSSSTTSSFIIDANPNLEEETSDSFELGVQSEINKNTFSISFYNNFYDGFIELIKQPSPGVVDLYSNDNVGKVEIYGYELSWGKREWEIIENYPPVDLGFSLSWAEGKKVDNDMPLNTIEPWKANSYLYWESLEEDLGLRLGLTYRASKEIDQIDHSNGPKLPINDSLVLDLSSWHKLSENWRISGGINNVTNEKFFLWSGAGRGGGHSSSSVEEKNTQPGINGFIQIEATF